MEENKLLDILSDISFSVTLTNYILVYHLLLQLGFLSKIDSFHG